MDLLLQERQDRASGPGRYGTDGPGDRGTDRRAVYGGEVGKTDGRRKQTNRRLRSGPIEKIIVPPKYWHLTFRRRTLGYPINVTRVYFGAANDLPVSR